MTLLAQELSPCIRPNPQSCRWLAGGSLQWSKLTGSTSLTFSKDDIACALAVSMLDMFVFQCGFPQHSLEWLHPGRVVQWCTCDISGTATILSIHSPHVVGAGGTVWWSGCVWMTAGTRKLICHTSYLIHGCRWLDPLLKDECSSKASSDSPKTSPWAAVSF